jgi:Immunity protein family (Imm11)
MSEMVWVSRAVGHASNLRPFRNDVGERDHDRLVENQRRIERGEPLGPADFPSEIYGTPEAAEKDYNLPDLFYGYGYWIVSSAAADILRRFDLGQGDLRPVRVLKSDRRTPVGGEWFTLNFGNRKQALIPARSQNIRQRAQGLYKASAILRDNDLAVSGAALQGPDMWVDSQMWDALFLSEALGNALKKAKADRGFMLLEGRVVGT